VKKWLTQHKNLKYTAVLSQPEESDNWQGKRGYIAEAVVEEYSDLSGHDVYLSGPPAMIKSGMETFYNKGLPETQIYSDSFEYSDDALKAMGIQKPGVVE
jgi:CDP-4-dehydro-6-deoxyglucose reductase